MACPPAERPAAEPAPPSVQTVTLAVVGRHLLGEERNHELVDLGGTLAETTATAPVYRLYCIGQGEGAVPGVLRTGDGGVSIEVELWDLPSTAVGTFLRKIPAPLGLGWLLLVDGRSFLGFLCESFAVGAAVDISASGGWRAHQRTTSSNRTETPEDP
jgi:allophanate hydrolase